jgi:hypothetical protein
MKRLFLVTSLAMMAVAGAPIASAGAAETAVGTCHLEGTATFTPELTNTPKPTTYSFTSSKGSCKSVPETEFLKATVAGNAELSCPAGAGTGGSGELEFKVKATGKIEKAKFSFNFTAAAGIVPFVTTGEVLGTGVATFLKDPNSRKACLEAGKAKELTFEAETAGII